jgi:hypothetical protein
VLGDRNTRVRNVEYKKVICIFGIPGVHWVSRRMVQFY